MQISSQFDSGNISVIRAEHPNDIVLEINKDNQSDFYQWFHFRLYTTPLQPHNLKIQNLAKSAYPEGWKGYDVVASYDRNEWFRVEAEFDGENLRFDFTPEYETVYFAYFTPYSYERHLDLVSDAQCSPLCQHLILGQTIDGRDMSLLVIGDDSAKNQTKKHIWITARQHPGETMAEWCAEGIIYRLLDEQDGLSRKLLEDAVFYIVPNMNPDGGVRGHLRTNAVGVNLNREWKTPSLTSSPEVFFVLEKMKEVGVDAYLDLHGDEALPYNFVAGCEGIPSYDDELAAIENLFKQTLLQTTPEFQDVYGYPKDAPGQADLTIASNAVGERFKCLAYTVEMPFKDNNDVPDPVYGWSGQRSQQLGEDLLVALRAVIAHIK